ncbi:MAG: DUF881 domain-containing protein [Candidatus Peregrinibacteria bacterium]|nr:DUF881 domain-containing protein [Candidatus Peregrinibacteria bacterium]MDZ4245161.1 DUF881 domain-containing protein [Candidatus Gracilibacteria bacterium]
MRSTITITFLFLMAGALIGVLFSTQFTENLLIPGSHPTEVIEAQHELVMLYTEEQGVLKSQITNLRSSIADLQEQNSYFIPTEEQNKLNKIKSDLGLTQITGPGIEIIFEDSPTVNRPELDVNNDALIHAADLRDLTNLIFSTNTKGIAINNQRIIFSSPINCVGNTILVNNFNMLPPFTISVVTDNPTEILRLLTDDKLLFDIYRRVEDHGIVLKFQAKDSISLPLYNGNFRTDNLAKITEIQQ